MRRTNLASFVALAFLLAATACGDDDGGGAIDASIDASPPDAPPPADAMPPDARPDAMPPIDAAPPPPPDTTCAGDPPPMTATDPVTVSGVVNDPNPTGGGPGGPVADVNIAAHLISDDSIVASTASAAPDGAYTLTAVTGGVPINGYIRMDKEPAMGTATYVPSTFYPADPLAADVMGLQIPLFDYQLLTLLTFIGVPAQDMNKGIVGVIVLDCANNPVEGATVNLSPMSGQVVYAGADDAPDPSLTATSSAGFALIVNVDPGTVAVNADWGGTPFEAHDIRVISSQHPDGTQRTEITFANVHP